MKDKELLEWFLDKREYKNDNLEEIGKILWNKNCENKVIFYYEALKIISEDHQKSKYYYPLLNEYLQILTENNELNFSEKAEVIARVQSFIFSNSKNYDIFNYMGKFAEYMDKDNKYSNEFINKNYYNIKDFPKQWKQAKDDGDGIGLPGEE
jgi:hypothetical protein